MTLLVCQAQAAPEAPSIDPPAVAFVWRSDGLIADALSASALSLTALGAATQTREMMLGATAVYLGSAALAAPITYWSRGEVLRGLASLGVRLGAMSALASAGFVIGNARDDSIFELGEKAGLGLAVGVLGGHLIAAAVDALWLAFD